MRRKRQFVTALLACLVMAALGLGHTSDSQPTRHDAMVRMDDGVELNTSVFAPDGSAAYALLGDGALIQWTPRRNHLREIEVRGTTFLHFRALAVDPATGRLWATDKDEVWSLHPEGIEPTRYPSRFYGAMTCFGIVMLMHQW